MNGKGRINSFVVLIPFQYCRVSFGSRHPFVSRNTRIFLWKPLNITNIVSTPFERSPSSSIASLSSACYKTLTYSYFSISVHRKKSSPNSFTSKVAEMWNNSASRGSRTMRSVSSYSRASCNSSKPNAPSTSSTPGFQLAA